MPTTVIPWDVIPDEYHDGDKVRAGWVQLGPHEWLEVGDVLLGYVDGVCHRTVVVSGNYLGTKFVDMANVNTPYVWVGFRKLVDQEGPVVTRYTIAVGRAHNKGSI